MEQICSPLTIIIDSDDFITNDAVQNFIEINENMLIIRILVHTPF